MLLLTVIKFSRRINPHKALSKNFLKYHNLHVALISLEYWVWKFIYELDNSEIFLKILKRKILFHMYISDVDKQTLSSAIYPKKEPAANV